MAGPEAAVDLHMGSTTLASARNNSMGWTYLPAGHPMKRKREDVHDSVLAHAPTAKTPRPDSQTAALFSVPHDEHRGPANVSSHASLPSPTSQQPALQINYLARQQPGDLSLLDPAADNLPSCVNTLSHYTSVLDRSESLANNLGARPLSSILLQRFERMFDGPPAVLNHPGSQLPAISWFDVAHASSDPIDFSETEDASAGRRIVRLRVHDCLVQISWEEWQMVRSGLLQKMMPAQPVSEDEDKELATLDILEDTVSRVVALADQVAARGRQFNHRLKARREAIKEGRPPGARPSLQTRQELTRLFTANRRPASHEVIHSQQAPITAMTPYPAAPLSVSGSAASPIQANASAPSSASKPRRPPAPPAPEGPFKATMTHRMEILPKGTRVYPPCDRCRRLRIDCLKNLTACMGCTKKHCKCSWRDVSEDELPRGAIISQENGVMSGLGPMAQEVDYAGIEAPPQVGGAVEGHDEHNDTNDTNGRRLSDPAEDSRNEAMNDDRRPPTQHGALDGTAGDLHGTSPGMHALSIASSNDHPTSPGVHMAVNGPQASPVS